MHKIKLSQLIVGIKGAGEMASAVAWRLYMANIRRIFMAEIPFPLAVRRGVSFCEAIYDGHKTVEDVTAVKVNRLDSIYQAWDDGKIAIGADPEWQMLEGIKTDVLIDAILAKKNLGTKMGEAQLVIGLGPGFCVDRDVNTVIETNRGHNLGRIITAGSAEPNTGIPGPIGGFTDERVLRAPVTGELIPQRKIGDLIDKGQIVASINGKEVQARIDGVLRGLIRTNSQVLQGLKIGDIDPRGEVGYCYTISDKARAIAGSVLEAVLRVFNS